MQPARDSITETTATVGGRVAQSAAPGFGLNTLPEVDFPGNTPDFVRPLFLIGRCLASFAATESARL